MSAIEIVYCVLLGLIVVAFFGCWLALLLDEGFITFDFKSKIYKNRLKKCILATRAGDAYQQLKHLKKLLKTSYSRNRLETLVFEQQRDTLLMKRLSDEQTEIRHLWKITKNLNLFTSIECDHIAKINSGVNQGVLNVFKNYNLPRTYPQKFFNTDSKVQSSTRHKKSPRSKVICKPSFVKSTATHVTYYF